VPAKQFSQQPFLEKKAGEKTVKKGFTHLFCPTCGATDCLFVKGRCLPCFLKEHKLLLLPEKIELPQCKQCGKILFSRKMQNFDLELLRQFVKKKCKVKELNNATLTVDLLEINEKSLLPSAKALGKNGLRQSLLPSAKALGKNGLRQSLLPSAKALGKNGLRQSLLLLQKPCEKSRRQEMQANVTAKGLIENTPVLAEYKTTISFPLMQCDACMKLKSNYFEATIQLRGEKAPAAFNRLRQLLASLQKRDGLAAIVSATEKKNSIDAIVGSKKAAALAVKQLKKEFKTGATKTFKLIGVDRTGKQKKRATFAIRV
jgi:NMD protein affecting ribosome stability and mRNA decay